MTTTVTRQGDTWDVLSLRLYGDEHFMDILIAANAEHRRTVIFPSGVVLNVPEIDRETAGFADDLPIWKRGDPL